MSVSLTRSLARSRSLALCIFDGLSYGFQLDCSSSSSLLSAVVTVPFCVFVCSPSSLCICSTRVTITGTMAQSYTFTLIVALVFSAFGSVCVCVEHTICRICFYVFPFPFSSFIHPSNTLSFFLYLWFAVSLYSHKIFSEQSNSNQLLEHTHLHTTLTLTLTRIQHRVKRARREHFIHTLYTVKFSAFEASMISITDVCIRVYKSV